MYTDGLSESRVAASAERLGDDGLLDLIAASHARAGGTADGLTAELAAQLHRVCNTCDDDRAVIAFMSSRR